MKMKKIFILFSLNHKKISIVYLFLGIWSGFIGLGLSMIIRLNLMSPYHKVILTELYNLTITRQGIVMIFFLDAYLNWGVCTWARGLVEHSTNPFLESIFLVGGRLYVNFANLADSRLYIDWVLRKPMFVWGYYFTSFLLFLSIPVLVGTITMLLFGRKFGTLYFDPLGGGDSIIFQHIFWFCRHPEIYVLILPGFSMIGDICTELRKRKSLVGYLGMVLAMFLIAVLGFII
ncbi:unnamed protein product [Protopolystoma xenopodis]|uniref:Cytochrome c oxidase subunit 1 n=1 Tax=Protopolystoma xenopodis TaxID=117903 RepID=A0A448WDL1_9PLAT|nr:unnamed protein product [Protopolystoma xenopodis]